MAADSSRRPAGRPTLAHPREVEAHGVKCPAPACGYVNYNPNAVVCELCHAPLTPPKGEPPGAAKAGGELGAALGAVEKEGAKPAPARPAAPAQVASAAAPSATDARGPLDVALFVLALPAAFPAALVVAARRLSLADIGPSGWWAGALLALTAALGLALGPGGAFAWALPAVLLAGAAGGVLLVRRREPAAGYAGLGASLALCCGLLGFALLGAPSGNLEHGAEISAMCRTGDGVVVTGGRDGRLVWWSLPTSARLGEAPAHAGPVLALAGGGGLVASGGEDGRARLWRGPAEEGPALDGDLTGGVTALAFAPTAPPRLAAGGLEGQLALWDAAEGGAPEALPGGKAAVSALAWSPDGRRLVVGAADGAVVVWDAERGRVERALEPRKAPVMTLGVSPDGKVLAVGSDDGRLLVGPLEGDDAAAREVVLEGAPRALAWLPDGTLLLGLESRRVVWLDPRTGTERAGAALLARGGAVTGVLPVRDGALVSAGRAATRVALDGVPGPD